jgi:hypothetical protein
LVGTIQLNTPKKRQDLQLDEKTMHWNKKTGSVRRFGARTHHFHFHTSKRLDCAIRGVRNEPTDISIGSNAKIGVWRKNENQSKTQRAKSTPRSQTSWFWTNRKTLRIVLSLQRTPHR